METLNRLKAVLIEKQKTSRWLTEPKIRMKIDAIPMLFNSPR